MKHYLDPQTGKLFAYEADGSQDHLIPQGYIPQTADAARALIQQRQEAVFNANSYARKRAAEYPAIGDQLDALYHAGVFPTDMAARIKAVKDKYPK